VTTIVYIANADSHDISVLRLEPGVAALAEVERFAVGGAVMPLALHPDRRVLYASLRSEPFEVASLGVDPASGRLRELGRAPLPASMCWISTDRAGRFLLAASYGDSVVSVGPIGPDGVAGPAQQVVRTESNAHSIRVDPGNRHAFAACLGGGVIRQFRFDAASGRLTDNDPPAWSARTGAGPRHFAFHPRLPMVYLLNELDAGIDAIEFDAGSGRFGARRTVSALPPGFSGGAPWAAEIRLTPDGRFLYASERRSSTLAGFAIDATTGQLASLGSTLTEAQPRGFAIGPDGRSLIAVGQASHRLSHYAIDAGHGGLTKLADQAVGHNPNWVEIVELPG
jgi:6-phosphogluconolactonase